MKKDNVFEQYGYTWERQSGECDVPLWTTYTECFWIDAWWYDGLYDGGPFYQCVVGLRGELIAKGTGTHRTFKGALVRALIDTSYKLLCDVRRLEKEKEERDAEQK